MDAAHKKAEAIRNGHRSAGEHGSSYGYTVNSKGKVIGESNPVVKSISKSMIEGAGYNQGLNPSSSTQSTPMIGRAPDYYVLNVSGGVFGVGGTASIVIDRYGNGMSQAVSQRAKLFCRLEEMEVLDGCSLKIIEHLLLNNLGVLLKGALQISPWVLV